MNNNNVRTFKDVAKAISKYNENPDEFMKKIREHKEKNKDGAIDILDKKPEQESILINEYNIDEKPVEHTSEVDKNSSDNSCDIK